MNPVVRKPREDTAPVYGQGDFLEEVYFPNSLPLLPIISQPLLIP
jgi:hypothetical protein